MRYFALVFFCLLAGRSSATTDCGAFEELQFLIQYYESILNNLPVPALTYGDTAAAAFRNSFLSTLISYGLNIACNTYNQAERRGDELVANIRKYYKQLRELIEAIDEDNDDPICLNDALKKLINQIQILLDLKPGNQKIERPVLPPVPEQQIQVKNITSELSLNETFIDLETTIDHMGDQIYGYYNSMFISGWQSTRPYLDMMRVKFYNDILNDRCLPVYKKIVEKVCDYDYVIRRHVSPKTWRYFEKVKDCIIRISNDYNDSKHAPVEEAGKIA